MKKETTINEVLEFLQENMVTKQEIRQEFDGLRKEFDGLRKEFDGLRKEFDEFRSETTGELRMIRNELEEIKKRLTILEKRTIEDADAAAKDVLELRHRIEYLEKQVKQLQTLR